MTLRPTAALRFVSTLRKMDAQPKKTVIVRLASKSILLSHRTPWRRRPTSSTTPLPSCPTHPMHCRPSL
jgi:hypothetical protein